MTTRTPLIRRPWLPAVIVFSLIAIPMAAAITVFAFRLTTMLIIDGLVARKPPPLSESEMIGDWYLEDSGLRLSTITLADDGTFVIDQLQTGVFGDDVWTAPDRSDRAQTTDVSGTWETDAAGDLHLSSAELGATELELVQSWDHLVFFQRETPTAADYWDVTCFTVGRSDGTPGDCLRVDSR